MLVMRTVYSNVNVAYRYKLHESVNGQLMSESVVMFESVVLPPKAGGWANQLTLLELK